MTPRILVTAAGGTLAPLNIRLLREGVRHPAWVVAVDQRPDALGRHFADAFVVVPNGTEPGYVETIASIVDQYGIDLVLPWSDEEAIALASNRDLIESMGATLACSRLSALRIMTDKEETFRHLSRNGIRVPKWDLATTESELIGLIERYAADFGEFAVKPKRARGNRGTVVVDCQHQGAKPYLGSRELRSDLKTFRDELIGDVVKTLPVLVMQKLQAPVYDIDVLSWEGAMLHAVPRRRLNPAGIPFLGSEIAPSPGLLDLASHITAALKLSWLYDYDIMSDRDGNPVVIEVNPRPSGSIAASIIAGYPFYDELIAMAIGKPATKWGEILHCTIVPYVDCAVVQAPPI